MKLAVVCGEAPEPRETFLRRDIAVLRARFDVRVFGLGRRAPAPRLLPLLRGLPLRPALSLALRLRTVREIADYVADGGAIIAHFAWTTADLAAAAARLAGRPWFCFVHAWDVFTRPPAELRRRTATAARVIACSQAAADACAAAGIPAAKIAVIHHAVPPLPVPQFPAMRPLTVVAAGRLVEKKGFDLLLRAWPAVRRALPSARLLIVGDGPCAAELRRRAAKAGGKQADIAFTGALPEEETLRALASADILALPSRRLTNGDRDGIANVLLEAMALGVPVVTTDAGAAGEVVTDGVTGVLLPCPATPEALADALVRLARDGARRAALASNARAFVRARFSPDAYLAAASALLSVCADTAFSSNVSYHRK